MSHPNIYSLKATIDPEDVIYPLFIDDKPGHRLFDVTEIAKRTGYSRRKARRHIEHLIKQGVVELAYVNN